MESNFPSLSELAAKRNDGIMLRANGKPLKPIRGPQVVHAIPRNFRSRLGVLVFILVVVDIPFSSFDKGVWQHPTLSWGANLEYWFVITNPLIEVLAKVFQIGIRALVIEN
ncbi:hypothetical protein Tco_1215577 [Tanacetum coccineum]